jgi:hypothetical protein
LFSAKLICVEFYPRTSPITIAGDRTARWAKPFHAAKEGPSLGKHAQRSPPNLCSVGYTTFTALLHDKFLRPTGVFALQQDALRAFPVDMFTVRALAIGLLPKTAERIAPRDRSPRLSPSAGQQVGAIPADDDVDLVDGLL